MNITNPYAQAGWYNPENPSSIGQRPGTTQSSSQPPTFGALPYYPEHSAPPAKRYTFSTQGPRIIQGCEVVDGDSGATAFKIKMAHDGYDYTSLQSPNGTPRGYIVWKPDGPEIEIYGVVARQKAKGWLSLSPDQSSRFMQFRDKHYVWQFARDAMYLYGYELNRHQQLGKIYPVNNGTTIFETNQSLIDNGMLESVILAITLLLSERFRD